ncbi:MAG TPA: hypothetical protein ENO36_00615 [Fervidicoccus fontis]|uniref:Phosphoribosyltransferase domain-containing protein n=1 Tax=Fervidicoccus fontis TaxID=683846 RepID=A0A7C2UQ90_9CREN|nr:hypothetical protein [Fervidicoccus fontis]
MSRYLFIYKNSFSEWGLKLIFPTKFVEWWEVTEWSWRLSEKIDGSGWRPEAIVAVGKGGVVISRILCDMLEVSVMAVLPIRYREHSAGKRNYLSELIEVFYRGQRGNYSIEEGIGEVVGKLSPEIPLDIHMDLKGKRTLIVEEIIATGMHMDLARRIVEKEWRAGETRSAALVWKAPEGKGQPDYYFIRPSRFVWFQFPWSRLNDYIQFLYTIIEVESRENGKRIWSKAELEEQFQIWYGRKPEQKYFLKALRALQRERAIRIEGEVIRIS